MKTIGIVGGLSPESTAWYYQRIIECHRERAGDQRYPRILVASVCFEEFLDLQQAGRWDELAARLSQEILLLERAGADFTLIASNTPHKVAAQLQHARPFFSILDAAAAAARKRGIARVGLTGTMYTMSDGFYADGLKARGIESVLPEPRERGAIHRLIFGELVRGKASAAGRAEFDAVARALMKRGAEAILLGCTELTHLTQPAPEWPFIDTAREHAEAAWRIAAGEENLAGLG